MSSSSAPLLQPKELGPQRLASQSDVNLSSKTRTVKATTILRLIILVLSPVVVISFLSRTAQRHIIFWPCIILSLNFAANLAALLFGIRVFWKEGRVPVAVAAALGDAIGAIAVLIAVYVVTWKRPRADRAESLIALVMGYLAGVIQFLLASATALEIDFDITGTRASKRIQLPSGDL
ncbi:hypothetical protein BP6252_09609 [Coleophoma cylindrospora]|uniref:Uncharacterized protein n=1 Tax=Coleophoma cylindrospora TaxID=1849047 RepID=A0A3D8QWR2_9HELO|nr:hypothetical protein BP6252_09609 [Coleophoma cylindrospora]